MLSDLKVRTLKPGTTPYKVTHRDGLYLLVTPRGSRWWRYDYRYRGKRTGVAVLERRLRVSVGIAGNWNQRPPGAYLAGGGTNHGE